MFFGYWKREAKRLQDAVWELEEAVSSLEGERNSLNREARKAEDALRNANAQLAAAELQLAAERQDNESLRRKLKSVQDEADHARHCYEQCEIDRQAIADERDAAVKQRDEWRETAEHASALVGRTFAACERFMADLSKLKGATDARTDAVAPESGEATDQAGAEARPCRQGHPCCPVCRGSGNPNTCPRRDPEITLDVCP